MEMAQLALQADLPSEGKQVVDKGFASGALGTGAAGRAAKRLRDLVDKRLAEDAAARAEDEKSGRWPRRSGDPLVVARHEPGLQRPGRQGHPADAAGHRQGRPEAARRRQAAPRHRPARRRRQGQGAGHLQDASRATTARPTWRACGRSTPAATADPRARRAATGVAGDAAYFGARRIAPSRRITSPLSISLVTIWCTSLA